VRLEVLTVYRWRAKKRIYYELVADLEAMTKLIKELMLVIKKRH